MSPSHVKYKFLHIKPLKFIPEIAFMPMFYPYPMKYIQTVLERFIGPTSPYYYVVIVSYRKKCLFALNFVLFALFFRY